MSTEPSASSSPKMSVRITGLSPSCSPRIKPIATPAMEVLRGTPTLVNTQPFIHIHFHYVITCTHYNKPASSIAIQQAQTVAMLELPQLSVISDSARIEYGNTSPGGMLGSSARSDNIYIHTSESLKNQSQRPFQQWPTPARLPCPTCQTIENTWEIRSSTTHIHTYSLSSPLYD